MPSRISQGSFSCQLWMNTGREAAQSSWEVAFQRRAMQRVMTCPEDLAAGCPHPCARTLQSAQSMGSVLSNQPRGLFPGLAFGEAWLSEDSRLCSKQTPCQCSGLGERPPGCGGWSVVGGGWASPALLSHFPPFTSPGSGGRLDAPI